MKLESLTLKNFRGYSAPTTIQFSDITALIGRNDAGKSTILEALEIFFNNTIVSCEREDLSINADSSDIEISCTFVDFPNEVVIDAANPTNLSEEYLLNIEGKLEIKKVFTATAAKPKEKIFLICNHPTVGGANDLMDLKRNDLRARADELGIDSANYNRNINSSMRSAIRQGFEDLSCSVQDLFIDKEDSKKIYDALKLYLPVYALFQSDRQSNDEDKEVTDPMKLAVQQALQELGPELEHIKTQVRNRAVETANRTLEKLKEMAPDLAQELIPEFKTDPKFDSQFKLTIKSEDNIPVNKRGSGVRRLILLNFFRAEAEKRRNGNAGAKVIYAFEEPETSQHPNHQEMLMRAFLDLSNTEDTQIILTTHTPALAGLLPLSSLRFINKQNNGVRLIEQGTEEVFVKISDTLGLLPDPISNAARALLLVEGKGDVTFVNHTAQMLKDGGYLPATLLEKNFAIIPIGGCGNLKHWRTLKLAEQFNIPYCILLDSDSGTPEAQINLNAINQLREQGIKAYVTKKREPENYIHISILNLPVANQLAYGDTDDAKQLISVAKQRKKEEVLDSYWPRMTPQLIRQVETYNDGNNERYEFTEMFIDYLTVCD